MKRFRSKTYETANFINTTQENMKEKKLKYDF